jgi:bacteriorhodopsin
MVGLTEEKQMGDVPVPDVMDSSGRMKRLIIGLIAGVTAAAIAYFVSDSMAKPTPGPSAGGAYSHGAYKFVYYMTALAGGAVFIITTVVLETRAKKQWKREQEIAHARALKK